MRRFWASGLMAIVISGPASAQETPVIPQFAEETASSGIAHTYKGEWEYMVGGGVGVMDCNGDHMPDMALAGGESPATFYRNVGKPGQPLSFKAEPSGLELDKVLGAYPIDADGDGHVDVMLLRQGENVLMKGDGTCHFTRANEAWGFDGGNAWSAAFAATWEKGANWPTLAIGNYINREEEFSPWGSCTDNWLHRPAGEGKFAPPLPLKPSYCPLSLLFTDWNRSGQPALRVSNDREYYEGGQEQMWTLAPAAEPHLITPEEGWGYVRIWGMGIASTDLNGDTYPDYFLTSMADQRLQWLKEIPKDGKPKPTYVELAFSKGLTAHRPFTGGDERPSTGWHAEFQDVNNDGFQDLFIAKGNVSQMPDFAEKDPNNLLLQGADGKFVEIANKAGVASVAQSRGGAVVDFNRDGLLDLVVNNRNEPAQIWRNVSTGPGNFIAIEPRMAGPNVDAINGWIEVKTPDGKVQRKEITIGGGHASGHITPHHFGLGNETAAQVRILWPHAAEGEWQKVEAGKFLRIEPDKEPTRF